jgi:hypothetical protein
MKKAIATASMIAALGSAAPVRSAEAASRGNDHEVCSTAQVSHGTREVCKEFAGKRLVEKTTKTDQKFITETATQRTDKIQDTLRVVKYGFRKGHPYIKFESTTAHDTVTVTDIDPTQPTSTTPTPTNPTTTTTGTTPTTTPSPLPSPDCQTASYTADAGYYDQGNFYSDPGYTFTVDANWCYANGQITSDTINYLTNIPAGDGFNPTETATLNATGTELDISAFGTFSTLNENTGAYVAQMAGLSGELNADGTSAFQTTSNNGG